VGGRLDELVEGGVQGAGEDDELIQCEAAPAVLDAAERGLAEVRAAGQLLQRPALRHPQSADAFAYEAVQLSTILRHRQHRMPMPQFESASCAEGGQATTAS